MQPVQLIASLFELLRADKLNTDRHERFLARMDAATASIDASTARLKAIQWARGSQGMANPIRVSDR